MYSTSSEVQTLLIYGVFRDVFFARKFVFLVAHDGTKKSPLDITTYARLLARRSMLMHQTSQGSHMASVSNSFALVISLESRFR